jgi:precorrin-6A synthase
MRKLLIIGIGAGDPDFITVQAVKALATVDVFFMLEKGAAKDAMVETAPRALPAPRQAVAIASVEAPSPPRERRPADYDACVDDLNRAKQETFERLIADELGEGQVGAILAWGDPSLYDSTIRNIEAIAERLGLAYEVIPGISAVQALAARHRNHAQYRRPAGRDHHRRRLAEGWPAGIDSVVVMLDGEDTWRRFADQDIDIWWGAYLGTPQEILIAGRLKDVSDEIHRVRTAARERNGWIMDTYLMRRR